MLFFLTTSNLFAQKQEEKIVKLDNKFLQDSIFNSIDSLENKVKSLEEKINNIYGELGKDYWTYRGVKEQTNSKIIQQKRIIDSLNKLVAKNSKSISSNANASEKKIQETGQKADSQIAKLDSKNKLYWIIAALAILLLGGLIYWILGKRITYSKTDVETQIRNTKTSLEEESVKLDNKLVEVLETQLKLQQESTISQPVASNDQTDHSLALKVADETIRIQKNLGRMHESTKGLKQLNASIKRIKDNFASNGYELVDMLGKEYNEGMKATVNFVQDEDFEEGKRIITRIIKPQVNYKGEMIQTAQIEVTEA